MSRFCRLRDERWAEKREAGWIKGEGERNPRHPEPENGRAERDMPEGSGKNTSSVVVVVIIEWYSYFESVCSWNLMTGLMKQNFLNIFITVFVSTFTVCCTVLFVFCFFSRSWLVNSLKSTQWVWVRNLLASEGESAHLLNWTTFSHIMRLVQIKIQRRFIIHC